MDRFEQIHNKTWHGRMTNNRIMPKAGALNGDVEYSVCRIMGMGLVLGKCRLGIVKLKPDKSRQDRGRVRG